MNSKFKGSVLTEENAHGSTAWVKKDWFSQIIKILGTINWYMLGYIFTARRLIFTCTETVLREHKETDCTTAVWFCYSFLQNIYLMAPPMS